MLAFRCNFRILLNKLCGVRRQESGMNMMTSRVMVLTGEIRNVISFANCNQYLTHASVLLNLLAFTFYVFIWVTCTFMILITFLSGKLYQYLNCGHQMRPIKKIGNTPTFPSFFLSLGLLIFFWWKNKPALVCVTMYIPRWIKI